MNEERKYLINIIMNQKKQWESSANSWRRWYRFLTSLAIILAALTPMIEEIYKHEITRVLSIIMPISAAIISSIIISLGFETNWKANRASRYSADALLIDLTNIDVDINEIQKNYKEIFKVHLGEFTKSD